MDLVLAFKTPECFPCKTLSAMLGVEPTELSVPLQDAITIASCHVKPSKTNDTNRGVTRIPQSSPFGKKLSFGAGL